MKCKVCGSTDQGEELVLTNWPSRAQYFPDRKATSESLRTNIHIQVCRRCSHMQLDMEPVEYYREVIRSAAVSNNMKEFRLNQFRELANNRIGRQMDELRALEIGSGAGEYANILRSMGSEVITLDIQDREGDHIQGFLEEDYEPGIAREMKKRNRIDLVYSFNFIEHWPDPVKSLGIITKLAAEGTVFLLEVPNGEMILNEGDYSELIPDHLNYFSFSSFATLLSRVGLQVQSMQRIYDDYILSAVCTKPHGLGNSKLGRLKINHMEGIEKFKIFVESSQDRIVVWGASHQTLVYLAALPECKNIVGVVDSAQFKQNRYCIGSSYYIYPVENLEKLDADKVLVSCGGYTNEVLEIANRMINPGCRLYYFDNDGNICEHIR